ncbi:MAG: hypothetical protein ACM3ON_08625, partial [Chloroflexota bacterium]
PSPLIAPAACVIFSSMIGEGMTRDEMINLIEKAGKVPVERDAFYGVVSVNNNSDPHVRVR